MRKVPSRVWCASCCEVGVHWSAHCLSYVFLVVPSTKRSPGGGTCLFPLHGHSDPSNPQLEAHKMAVSWTVVSHAVLVLVSLFTFKRPSTLRVVRGGFMQLCVTSIPLGMLIEPSSEIAILICFRRSGQRCVAGERRSLSSTSTSRGVHNKFL